MKSTLRIALAIATLGVSGVLSVGSLSSAAGAQELCEAFGAPYCPPPDSDVGAGGEENEGEGAVGAGGLARTGSDTGPLVGIGLGLVAAGGAAAYAARRRAPTAQPTSPHVA